MTRASRTRCLVPFCRVTTARSVGSEWICGKHWRAVPISLRRRMRRWHRRYHKEFPGDDAHWKHAPGSRKRLMGVKLANICDKLWERAKRIAIEAATGIG
jgi:hypothetical protein